MATIHEQRRKNYIEKTAEEIFTSLTNIHVSEDVDESMISEPHYRFIVTSILKARLAEAIDRGALGAYADAYHKL